MCNLSMISVTQPKECFAIPLLMVPHKNIMVVVQEIAVNSNTSPPTSNSQESYAIQIEHFTSVVLDIGNAWLNDAMDI